MKPEQTRAARGWLGWTQAELAEKARVGLSTVKDYEAGKRTPIANNLDAMRRALEACGIRFTDDAVAGPLGAFAEGPQTPYEAPKPSRAKRPAKKK
ncbi:MAG: helix-turn-helix domain-containing protein [Alphaproteobacteria bacterium]